MATINNAPRTEDTSGTLQEVKAFQTGDTDNPIVQAIAISDPDVTGTNSFAGIVDQNAAPSGKKVLLVESVPLRPTSTRLFGTGDPTTNPEEIDDNLNHDSSEVDCTNARGLILYLYIDESGSLPASELLFELQFSPLASPGANDWYTYARDFWADLRYSQNVSTPIAECFDIELGSIGKRMRLRCSGTGSLSGTNHWDVWAYVTLIN